MAIDIEILESAVTVYCVGCMEKTVHSALACKSGSPDELELVCLICDREQLYFGEDVQNGLKRIHEEEFRAAFKEFFQEFRQRELFQF